jgi:tRNA/rRNA methyltransferase
MANFGFRDLAAVDPYGPVWKESRSAVGVSDLLRDCQAMSLDAAIKDAALVLGTSDGRRSLRRPVVSLPELSDYLKKNLPNRGRVAVLFGCEKTGLSREHIAHCHALVRIPTVPELPSMNLGQAVALLAYELSRPRGKQKALAPELAPAPAEQTEALLTEFLRVFPILGYMPGVAPALQARKVRDALKRMRPCAKDAGLLLSVLRRVK